MAEDIIENTIGRFGKYQSVLTFLLTIGRLPVQIQIYNVVFLVPGVKYVCLDDSSFNVTNHCPCDSPQYDESDILSSVTSEWDLICGRTALASLSQSLLQIGILPGSLLYGWISDRLMFAKHFPQHRQCSDHHMLVGTACYLSPLLAEVGQCLANISLVGRYGRRLAVYLSLLSSTIFVSLSAVVPQLWMFMMFRFLIGTSVGGTMLCCFVILVELSGSSFRNYTTVINEASDVLGYVLLPIIAFYVREWRYLQLVTSVPWLFVIAYYWIIPESPLWLITVGRREEAIQILETIAKRNGLGTENIRAIVNEKSSNTEEQPRGSYMDLFKTKKIRMYTIVNALIWMLCAHTYYGINQYIGRLQGNLYLNVLLSGLCLIPANLIILVTILYLNRKVSVSISFIIAAISLVLLLVIPSNSYSANLSFAIIGFVGIYSAFVQLYLLTCEIFPTIVRNSALGFASMFARIGSFIAPFVVNIHIEWVIIVIFSALSLCAATLCFFVPETKDIVLLNTVEQTENYEDKKSVNKS